MNTLLGKPRLDNFEEKIEFGLKLNQHIKTEVILEVDAMLYTILDLERRLEIDSGAFPDSVNGRDLE